LLPSGILSPNVIPVIANGVVIDPGVLLEEIKGLTERGIDCSINRMRNQTRYLYVCVRGFQYLAGVTT
jgi:adenylosuccinate synthase